MKKRKKNSFQHESHTVEAVDLATDTQIVENQKIELSKIPTSYKLDTDNKSTITSDNKATLDLPKDLTDRDFLTNSIGYKSNLELLVGMVVKRDKNNKYTLIKDYKKDSTIITSRIPANGILIEKKYDSKIGGGISYLIAASKIEKNSAYQFTISDVSEATITDKYLNTDKLFQTYNNDPEIDSYFIIRAATTTSILYKKFDKISGRVDFNAAAIKVNSNYYSENSDLKQDWKVGVNLTPVKEYIKGIGPR